MMQHTTMRISASSFAASMTYRTPTVSKMISLSASAMKTPDSEFPVFRFCMARTQTMAVASICRRSSSGTGVLHKCKRKRPRTCRLDKPTVCLRHASKSSSAERSSWTIFSRGSTRRRGWLQTNSTMRWWCRRRKRSDRSCCRMQHKEKRLVADEFNHAMVVQKKEEERQKLLQDAAEEIEELRCNLDSALLSELHPPSALGPHRKRNDHYKGMSGDEVVGVYRAQESQRRENEAQK